MPDPQTELQVPTMSLLETHFNFMRDRYLKTDAYKELKAFFQDDWLLQDNLQLDQCICVALGLLWWSYNQWNYLKEIEHDKNRCLDNSMKSMTQFVAFTEWVGYIKTRFPDVKVYIQEPKFDTPDIEFITSKGFEVIYHPEARDMMSKQTFLFAPSCDWDALFDMLAQAQPALYIMSDLEYAQEYMEAIQEDYGRDFENFSFEPYLKGTVRKFLEGRIRRNDPVPPTCNWMISPVVECGGEVIGPDNGKESDGVKEME